MVASKQSMEEIEELIKWSEENIDHVTNASHSASFDRFLWLESPVMDSLVSRVVTEIDKVSSRTRARKQDANKNLHFFVKVLFLNLLDLHKHTNLSLAIPLSSGSYTNENRYDQSLLSYRVVKEGYDALLENEYIEIVKRGYYDQTTGKGKVTRIQATSKLRKEFDTLFPESFLFFFRHPSEEIIFQKDTNKKHIDYVDTTYSQQARSNLHIINKGLNRQWCDLELDAEGFAKLKEQIQRRYETTKEKDNYTRKPYLDLNARSLYRIYNNGDRKDQSQNFQEGGRFYGGWWQQLPKEYRKYIIINGKRTVEVDFANLHPNMLYAMEEKKLEGDAYEIEGVERAYAKKAFNQLINGKKQLRAPDDFKPTSGLTWKDVLVKVEKRHQSVAKYFKTGYGLKLQKVDSDILEKVLLHFIRMRYACLPIHDSVLIHHALLEELEAVMRREYIAVLGKDIPFKIDNYFQMAADESALVTERETLGMTEQEKIAYAMQSSSFDELFLNRPPHEERLDLWQELYSKHSTMKR